VQERALGVICGEVGPGKTVAARAATAGLDPSRHTHCGLPVGGGWKAVATRGRKPSMAGEVCDEDEVVAGPDEVGHARVS
jgi:hypothetical protein